MPYKNKADRNYRREYLRSQDSEEQKKRRAQRNAARALMLKAGKVKKGDGKDVDHRTPISKGGTNKPGNLRVQTARNNRSYPRNKDHSVK